MTETSTPAAEQVGSPPPFDPELAAALAPLAEFLSPALTPDMIPLLRQPNPAMPAPTDEDLRREGAFTVEQRTVPGPDGHLPADLPAHRCRPPDRGDLLHARRRHGYGRQPFGHPRDAHMG